MLASVCSQFERLSLKDLIEARDLFHVHLMNKENVVATALGKYRARPEQIEDNRIVPSSTDAEKKTPKRLCNTAVAANSWPCILVFVSEWIPENQFNTYKMLDFAVPPRLYMPDGRLVPVCTIEVDKATKGDGPVPLNNLNFPTNVIGGGFPILTNLQGMQRVASIGCIVSDGSMYYAITNKHATGDPGAEISTLVRGTPTPVGKSSRKQIGSLPFRDAYPGWSQDNLYVNADIGLVEIHDVSWWTTRIMNIGNPDSMLDLNTQTLTLDLIGRKVKGFGCVSGLVEGKIDALFYRYRSVGGFEYVSDFLIGPPSAGKPFDIHHGDSGATLLVECKSPESYGNGQRTLWRPFSILWGRHRFLGADASQHDAYGLATSLSTACRILEVDVVPDWNTDHEFIWGKVGHFGLANWAINALAAKGSPKKLAQLLKNNIANITFPTGQISADLNAPNAEYAEFCPLSDVPDVVWKQNAYGKGARGSKEGVQHHADIDQEITPGRSLASLFKKDPSSLDPAIWDEFYKEAGAAWQQRGALPFRVGQLFEELAAYAHAGKAAECVVVAGVMAHYVGDACMSLHASYLHHGYPAKEEGAKNKGYDVHEVYENTMIGNHIDDIVLAIEKVCKAQDKNSSEKLPEITNADQAAQAAMRLMLQTIKRLPPRELVDCYLDTKANGNKAAAEAMWDAYGKETVAALARGTRLLVKLWQDAWKKGKGDASVKKLDVSRKAITKLVLNKEFAPSLTLKDLIGSSKKKATANAGSGTSAAKRKRTAKR